MIMFKAYRADRRIKKARQDGSTTLDLSEMGLTEVPEAIGQLTSLQVLNLSFNQISSVPEVLEKLTSLQVLYLSFNQISSVPEVMGKLTSLQGLDLSFNQISSLPEGLGKLTTSLQWLCLPFNQISSLPEGLGKLTSLQRLDLSGNQISSLPEELGKLTSLQRLDLSGNQISSLPEGLGKLTSLQRLDLSRNQISSLPEGLGKLTSLQRLDLSENPLNPELAAAYSQGSKVLLQYLRSQARSRQVELNEAKLILVGEGAVGKTSLLGALCGDEWVENRPRTHGIELKSFTVKVPDSGKEIKLNGWDFGGQAVYRPTHQLFFSAPAVYLVLWKPREGTQQNFIEYWINLIKHRAPEAKILVVATHGGPNARQPDIDSDDITTRFGGDTVLGFFHVDSKSDATVNPIGIHELKEAIARAASLPEVGRKVPAKWQQVREKLQTTAKAYLSYDQAIELCAEQEMDKSEAKLFPIISHTLGHLIHYHNDNLLKNIVILKPDWLAKAISFVLDDKETRENGGLVKLTRLKQLWNDPQREETERYPSELHPHFLKLMERFDLSYRVAVDPLSSEPSDTSLIAQLLSDKCPTELVKQNWSDKPPAGKSEKQLICRIVDERGKSANAEGLFYLLIVRLHKYSLGKKDYRKSVHWKRGLMLDDDYNGRALLEYKGTDLWIKVRAAYPEFLIHELSKEVKWLVEYFWKGLKCQVMVPCVDPCGKGAPGTGLFDVEKLIKSKSLGMPKFPCMLQGCAQLQDIDRLLRNAPSQQTTSQIPFDPQPMIEALEKLNKIDAVLENLDEINEDQQELLSKIDFQFSALKQMLADEAKDGPRLFSFQPIEPGFWDLDKWVKAKFTLTLWCEHSRQPLPSLNPEGDKRGVYELELEREWFVKAKPFLTLMATTLFLWNPVAGAAAKLALSDDEYKGIEKELELGLKVVNAVARGSQEALKDGGSDAPADWVGGDQGSRRAEGATLRQLHAILKEKDPSFGGLVRVQNKRHEFLWVHENFKDDDEYS